MRGFRMDCGTAGSLSCLVRDGSCSLRTAIIASSNKNNNGASMTKKWAYTSEDGFEKVSAEQVLRERNLYYNGAPTGKPYFSTHKVGNRKPVIHRNMGTGFFAYKSSGGGEVPAGGESLDHLLFKEVLASLAHTQLSLYRLTKKDPERVFSSRITITRTEKERPITKSDGSIYRPDLYMEFTSEHPLALKWEGKVYIEICRSHAVDAAKIDGLRGLEVPVIQVHIHDEKAYLYGYDDDETTDAREAAFVKNKKAMFESENGFLKAVMLSNPSSKEYLEAALRKQVEKVTRLEQEVASLREQLSKTAIERDSAADNLASMRRNVQSLDVQLKEAIAERNKSQDENASLKESVQTLTKDQNFWVLTYWGMAVLMLVLMGLLAWVQFFR